LRYVSVNTLHKGDDDDDDDDDDDNDECKIWIKFETSEGSKFLKCNFYAKPSCFYCRTLPSQSTIISNAKLSS
jgi:hypothetical protein